MSQQPAGCASRVLLLLLVLGVCWMLLLLLISVKRASDGLRAISTATHSTFIY